MNRYITPYNQYSVELAEKLECTGYIDKLKTAENVFKLDDVVDDIDEVIITSITFRTEIYFELIRKGVERKKIYIYEGGEVKRRFYFNENNRPIANVIVSTDHGMLIVNRNDYNDKNGAMYGLGYNIFEKSSCCFQEIQTMLKILELRRKHYGDEVIMIDCGANIGLHTIESAKLMSGWGKIYAFEAQERVFYQLAGNIAINNCFNATATWAAVGEVEGTIDIPVINYLQPASFGSLEIKQTENSKEFIGQSIDYFGEDMTPVRLLTLDKLAFSRVDFIKIDVEGMEIDVLRGAKNIISSCKPIIQIEIIKSDQSILRSFLLDLDYVIFDFGADIIAIHERDLVLNDFKNEGFV